MKKIATSALLVLLCITFVMGVYCYGTDQRYSLWKNFRTIVDSFESFPSFLELGDIWTKSYLGEPPPTLDEVREMLDNGEITIDDYAHYMRYHYEDSPLLQDPHFPIYGGEPLADPCMDKECIFNSGRAYIELAMPDSDNPVINALRSVVEFFNRVKYTMQWLVGFVFGIFKVVFAIFPWNGLVDADTPLFGDSDDLEFITSEEETTTDYNWPDETDMTDSGWGDIGEDTGPVIIL